MTMNSHEMEGESASPLGRSEGNRSADYARYMEGQRSVREEGAEGELAWELGPRVTWKHLSLEKLLPAEKSAQPFTIYETKPLLERILRKAGVNDYTVSLVEEEQELDQEIHQLNEEKDRQEGLGTEEGRQNAMGIASQMKDLLRQLDGEEITTEEGTTIKIKPGLRDLIRSRLSQESSMGGKKEWEELYWKVKGSIDLLTIYDQRKKCLSSWETYAEQLFLSGFFKTEMQVSSLLGILKDREYGPAIEESMRAYVDIHLKNIKVRFGQFGPEFDTLLSKWLERRGESFDRRDTDTQYDLFILKKQKGELQRGTPEEIKKAVEKDAKDGKNFRPPLQIPVKGDILARQLAACYVRERAAMAGGKFRPANAERAEIIAKRLLEFTLLSVWLSLPRNEEGKILPATEWEADKSDRSGKKVIVVEKGFIEEGCAKLEEEGSNELVKMTGASIKWTREQNANKPAGAPEFEWSNMPFEGLVSDFLHAQSAEVKYIDSHGNEINERNIVDSPKNPTFFDLWYFGVGPNKKRFTLAEIAEGIKYSDSVNIKTVSGVIDVGRKITFGLFAENEIDNWHFTMYKEGKILKRLLTNERGKDDVIAEITDPESLRNITKDIKVAVGGIDLTGLSKEQKGLVIDWLKLNLILTRLYAWRNSKESEAVFIRNDRTPAQNIGENVKIDYVAEVTADGVSRAITTVAFFEKKATYEIFNKNRYNQKFVTWSDFLKEHLK